MSSNFYMVSCNGRGKTRTFKNGKLMTEELDYLGIKLKSVFIGKFCWVDCGEDNCDCKQPTKYFVNDQPVSKWEFNEQTKILIITP